MWDKAVEAPCYRCRATSQILLWLCFECCFHLVPALLCSALLVFWTSAQKRGSRSGSDQWRPKEISSVPIFQRCTWSVLRPPNDGNCLTMCSALWVPIPRKKVPQKSCFLQFKPQGLIQPAMDTGNMLLTTSHNFCHECLLAVSLSGVSTL